MSQPAKQQLLSGSRHYYCLRRFSCIVAIWWPNMTSKVDNLDRG